MWRKSNRNRHQSTRKTRSRSMIGGALTDENRKDIIQCAIENIPEINTAANKRCIKMNEFDELRANIFKTSVGERVNLYLGTTSLVRITNWLRYTQIQLYRECLQKLKGHPKDDESGSPSPSASGRAASGRAESRSAERRSAQLEIDRREYAIRMASEARVREREFEERNRDIEERQLRKEERYQALLAQSEKERVIQAAKRAESERYRRIDRNSRDYM